MPTQEQIYRGFEGDVDSEVSWTEWELPERERTKHVHRLHPYLGKFVPQLVEIYLRRYFAQGSRILDPFAGSGTTLVECSTYGTPSVGVDISAFNALLCRVKTRRYDPSKVEHDLMEALVRLGDFVASEPQIRLGARDTASSSEGPASAFLQSWFAPRALAELRFYRSLASNYPESTDLLNVVLSRSARSARLTTHFDLDVPKRPQLAPYECYKHRRVCSPTEEAFKFLKRYTLDTIRRVAEYMRVRSDATVEVMHGDSRTVEFSGSFDGVITSPPYPGRIDYHEQHRYAFELLGLQGHESAEIGAASRGLSRAVVRDYVDDMIAVFANAKAHLHPGGVVVIVIDDSRELYNQILEGAGLEVLHRRRRHVNRRTGRRAGEFFEQIIVAR